MNLYSMLESKEREACASGVQFVPSVVINDLIHEPGGAKAKTRIWPTMTMAWDNTTFWPFSRTGSFAHECECAAIRRDSMNHVSGRSD